MPYESARTGRNVLLPFATTARPIDLWRGASQAYVCELHADSYEFSLTSELIFSEVFSTPPLLTVESLR